MTMRHEEGRFFSTPRKYFKSSDYTCVIFQTAFWACGGVWVA
jgi:hypothetical protein